jgi:hypothetical protein
MLRELKHVVSSQLHNCDLREVVITFLLCDTSPRYLEGAHNSQGTGHIPTAKLRLGPPGLTSWEFPAELHRAL